MVCTMKFAFSNSSPSVVVRHGSSVLLVPKIFQHPKILTCVLHCLPSLMNFSFRMKMSCYTSVTPAINVKQPATVYSFVGSSSLPNLIVSLYVLQVPLSKAIIVENRNPHLGEITADFDQTAIFLTNKPSE